jgi:hypothetical protein
LDQSCIDELCCRNAATYRRYPLNAFLDPQSLEGRTKIVASHGDESDPWTRAQCWLVPRDAFLPGDQKYGHGGNREQESVDVDPAALRYDDLSRVASQSKGRSERDQLRMPDGEERSPMDAASASKDRVGPYTTESLINQMLVSCATAERAGIRPAGIAILRLDETPTTPPCGFGLHARGQIRSRSAVDSMDSRCPAGLRPHACRTPSTAVRCWQWSPLGFCLLQSVEKRPSRPHHQRIRLEVEGRRILERIEHPDGLADSAATTATAASKRTSPVASPDDVSRRTPFIQPWVQNADNTVLGSL